MNTKYVTAGKPKVAGAVFVGPTTATLPTDPTSTLTGFTELGYVSEDGLTNSNSPESDKIKDWGGTTVLTVQTSKDDDFSFTLLEVLNPEVLKVVYGNDNVTVDSQSNVISVSANSDQPEDHAWVFDMVVRDGRMKRIVIPSASISELGDIVYAGNSASGYEITLSATPDSSGNTHYEYIEAES
jgi:hypothetical protein